MILRPAVEDLCEGGGLPSTCGQVLLQHEHEHYVAFGGEVHDVLGNDGPAFPPGDRSHLCVVGCAKTGLGDVDRVMAVGVAQEHRGGGWEHLIGQEGAHASSALR